MSTVTLHMGDCLEVMRGLADNSVDAVVTDPPYGMGKDFGNGSDEQGRAMWLIQSVMPELARVTRKGGMLFVFGSSRLIHKTINLGESAGLEFQRLLWLYKPNDCTYPWRGWLLKSEAIAVFSKGKPDKWDYEHYCHDTYIFNHSGGELSKDQHHPSVKPLKVIRDLVSKCPGSTILDPFMGSGTTGVACVQEGYDFIGIEREQEYFGIAQGRMADATEAPSRQHKFKMLPLFDWQEATA
jgi:site-specific DNA-methyltransferase (adenine-specific)